LTFKSVRSALAQGFAESAQWKGTCLALSPFCL
jgi:hypothetical protein